MADGSQYTESGPRGNRERLGSRKHLTEEDVARCKPLANGRPALILEIVNEVAAASGVPARAILGGSREKRVVLARHIAMYAARRAGFSLPLIAYAMNKDHTTVLHAVRSEKARRGEA